LANAIGIAGLEGSLESAVEHYREGIEQSTLKGGAHLARAYVALGRQYLSANRSGEAIAPFSQGIRIDPTNAEGYRALGDAYSALDRTAEAEAAFDNAVRVRPKCWYNRWMLARFYDREGCDGLASAELEKVIAEDPANLLIRSALARLYIREEKYFQAEEQLIYVIAREPRPAAVSNLGWTYFLRQRYAESLAQMERAAELDPDYHMIHGNLAEVARFVPGREQQAQEEYRRAVKLARQMVDENSASAFDRSWLSYWLACLRETDAALAEIEAVLGEAPNNKDAQFRAAIVYEMSGLREKALAALERALRLGYSITEVHRSERLYELMKTNVYQELERRVSKQNELAGHTAGCALDAKLAAEDGESAGPKSFSK
jgi:serine/threonine-protein kinase